MGQDSYLPLKKSGQSVIDQNLPYRFLRGQPLKYLGVFTDEHLKWDAQLQHINNKISKNIGILFKLRHYVPISTLKQLYYTLICPYLTYGLMNWGNAYHTKLNKIKVSQKNCIHRIFFCKRKRKSHTVLYTIRNLKVREYL